MEIIKGYHAHVYYNEERFDEAERLCIEASEKFSLRLGRRHKRPVGPHPMWSCQLAFAPEEFSQVIPWLALNRNGFTIFIHPETGDDLKDHTDHAIWMGTIEKLNLEIFQRKPD